MTSGHLPRNSGMTINPELIPIAISLVTLCMPWLYDGSLFSRERVWQRQFDRAERKRRRYTGAEIQDVRNTARRSL